MLKKIVIPETLPKPARRIASAMQSLLRISRAESERLIHDGMVRVNGRCFTQSHAWLQVGDLLEVDHVVQPSIPAVANKTIRTPIEILFEDEHLLVVNKPAHLLTVPTPHREKNTLQSYLTRKIQKEDRKGLAYCVHRLDRGVSGILIFAKSLEMANRLRDQFAERKPDRKYIAIVNGQLQQERGTVRSYLATDSDLNRYSVEDESQGELAITHFQKSLDLRNATMVTVKLETGRRNQIRVHLSELGHPILGDPRYGRDRNIHPAWPYKRLALHAESLGFRHPQTGESMEFKTSWPEEFRSFKRKSQSKPSDGRSKDPKR